MTVATNGLVVWLTGYPASGKSTLARAAAESLRQRSCAVCVLDGDQVRATLRPIPGYDDQARSDFYASLAGLAALLARQGLVVMVPATANRTAYRDAARAMAPRFLEVFVDTPLAECQRRDPKGLYQLSPSTLPGAGASYEPPAHPDLVVTPDSPSTDRLVQLVESTVAARPFKA